jgi:hypothetical protein
LDFFIYISETEESDESASTEEEEETRRGERKKSNSSRYRSRSTKRTRGTPSGLTPKAKEARIDAEPRFSAKFDWDGVLIEASAEREAANRRARIDKEKRYIASPRPGPTKPGVGVAVEAISTTTGKSNAAEATVETKAGTRVTAVTRIETVKI